MLRVLFPSLRLSFDFISMISSSKHFKFRLSSLYQHFYYGLCLCSKKIWLNSSRNALTLCCRFSFMHNFLYVVWDKDVSFKRKKKKLRGSLTVRAIFIEKDFFYLLNCLGTFVKNQLTKFVQVYFWTLNFCSIVLYI